MCKIHVRIKYRHQVCSVQVDACFIQFPRKRLSHCTGSGTVKLQCDYHIPCTVCVCMYMYMEHVQMCTVCVHVLYHVHVLVCQSHGDTCTCIFRRLLISAKLARFRASAWQDASDESEGRATRNRHCIRRGT